jgi:dipeptidyl-peptidase-4
MLMLNRLVAHKTAAAGCIMACLCGGIPARAQLSANMQGWMLRLNSGEFNGGGGRGARGGGGGRGGAAAAGRWLDGGKAYIANESAAGGVQAVRIETATGAKTPMPAEPAYRPPQLDRELRGGTPSADGRKLLFATDSHTVMIRKTASDYWVLDKGDNSWHKLGGNSTAGLMFAKFSPDGTRVAYLGDLHPAPNTAPKWNLYVEEIRTGSVKQLTTDSSEDIINGTSDWNNNEEFGLADCFLWSPDGARIAYYRFDQSGVQDFALVNYTDGLYPVITKYKYPKPGQTNSADRRES